ncbi:MAG: zinc-binding metallopeptidase [Polaribacter sp.]
MKKIKLVLLISFLIVSFTSCSEKDIPDESESVVKIDGGATKTKFDIFLNREFIVPYNIEFEYKLSDIETDFNYSIVPTTYEKGVKMANLIKYLCLEPYNKVAPKGFLKKYFPKQILLVGSAAFRNNGTRLLGTAEGGLKITLYEINNLDVTNVQNLFRLYFRTIYHEFSHILHQNIDYTTDFDKITATKYVGGTWNTFWDPSTKPSNKAGFISDYASKEPNEDFVELIAHYLTNTQQSWNDIISDAGSTGGPIITRKMEIVRKYLKDTWKIDIDALRDEIQSRANNLDNIDLDNIN